MIIDAHTHIGFGNYLIASPKSLVLSMRKSGIDRTIVFAGEVNLCSTPKLLEAVRPYKRVLFPVGSVSPLSSSRPTLAQVEHWLKEGIIYGLKFYSGYEYFFPYEKEIVPYLEMLEQYKRPAIFHTGDTYDVAKKALVKFALPIHIDEIAVRYPNLPIIIAHLGSPWFMDAAEIVYKNANVFADCSGWVYDSFSEEDEKFFSRHIEVVRGYLGSLEKILFGTDWPIAQQKPYRIFVERFLTTRKEKSRVFSQNAIDIFRLPITLKK